MFLLCAGVKLAALIFISICTCIYKTKDEEQDEKAEVLSDKQNGEVFVVSKGDNMNSNDLAYHNKAFEAEQNGIGGTTRL